MTTLTDFLLARITEEENAARIGAATPEAAMNITRWHPAHVLAECEAKRRIIEHQADPHGWWTTEQTEAAAAQAEHTLRVIAQVYADHPAFDPEWNLT